MDKSTDPVDRESSAHPSCDPRESTNHLHSGVVDDKYLGLVMYYHYYPLSEKQNGGKAGNSGYKYAWNELGFENGWPYVKAA